MCGIVGFITVPTDTIKLTTITKKMADTIAHRGPDDHGIWIDENCQIALGHQRLSILDLSSAGHQPMHSACNRFVMVFNGEIYNHLEIRDKLQCISHQLLDWRGHSDTETLLAAFVNWGIEKTLKACVGMFSIALWDRQENVLTLVRDRMGEKPLYYGWRGNTFMFASELKALKVHPDFNGEIDRQSLSLLLSFNYIPAPNSIYRGIRKLPSGTFLQIPINNYQLPVNATPYWSLGKVAKKGQSQLFSGSDDQALSLLENCLGDAVEGQQLADVPLGAFLSGGVDSSLVVSMMQTRSTQKVKTFTIGFDESQYNEAKYAKAVATHLGTEHSELYISPNDALDVIPKLPWLYDEPFADSSQIATFLVAKLARNHVKVALSGDGGDELFGGYNRHIWSRSIRNKTDWMPKSIRHGIGSVIGSIPSSSWDRINKISDSLLPSQYRTVHAGEKMHKVADLLAVDNDFDLYHGLVSQWPNPSEVVIGENFIDRMKAIVPNKKNFADIEHQMMFMDAMTYLPDDILCKVDRAAMGVSLETRVPLLDHRVVDLAWKLPLHMKIRNGQGKWLLRELLFKHVPKKLVDRPKQGFGLPVASWLRGPLREWVEELIDESRLKKEGYFHPQPIRIAWNEHLKGKNRQNQLWGVLMFQAWLEENS